MVTLNKEQTDSWARETLQAGNTKTRTHYEDGKVAIHEIVIEANDRVDVLELASSQVHLGLTGIGLGFYTNVHGGEVSAVGDTAMAKLLEAIPDLEFPGSNALREALGVEKTAEVEATKPVVGGYTAAAVSGKGSTGTREPE